MREALIALVQATFDVQLSNMEVVNVSSGMRIVFGNERYIPLAVYRGQGNMSIFAADPVKDGDIEKAVDVFLNPGD